MAHGFGAQLDLLFWDCGQAEPPGRACGGGCSPPCTGSRMKEIGREQGQNLLQSYPLLVTHFLLSTPSFPPPPKIAPSTGDQVGTSTSLGRTFPFRSRQVEKVARAKAIVRGTARPAGNVSPQPQRSQNDKKVGGREVCSLPLRTFPERCMIHFYLNPLNIGKKSWHQFRAL